MRVQCSVIHGLIFSFLCCFTLGANALVNNDREIDWANTLNLSTSQINKIQIYEQNYRDQLKLRLGNHCHDPSKKATVTQELKQQLQTNIHSILNTEQKAEASAAIKEQHRKMQLRHARDIAHLLKLDKDQMLTLYADIDGIDFNYQWPLNVKQRDIAKALFERTLLAHLTAEQQQQWQEVQQQQIDKWHSSDEFSPLCRN